MIDRTFCSDALSLTDNKYCCYYFTSLSSDISVAEAMRESKVRPKTMKS